jgi:hypothetical protein
MFSDPFTMQYLEGDRAMLNCSDEYNETARVVMVINMVRFKFKRVKSQVQLLETKTIFSLNKRNIQYLFTLSS